MDFLAWLQESLLLSIWEVLFTPDWILREEVSNRYY